MCSTIDRFLLPPLTNKAYLKGPFENERVFIEQESLIAAAAVRFALGPGWGMLLLFACQGLQGLQLRA